MTLSQSTSPDVASPPRGRRRWPWLVLVALFVLVLLARIAWVLSVEHAYITSYSVHPDGAISVAYVSGPDCPEVVWERAQVTTEGLVVDVAIRKHAPWAVVPLVAVECIAIIAPDAPFTQGAVLRIDGTEVTAVRPF